MINISNANVDKVVHKQKTNSSCNTLVPRQALRSSVAAGLEGISNVSRLQGTVFRLLSGPQRRMRNGSTDSFIPPLPAPTSYPTVKEKVFQGGTPSIHAPDFQRGILIMIEHVCGEENRNRAGRTPLG